MFLTLNEDKAISIDQEKAEETQKEGYQERTLEIQEPNDLMTQDFSLG